MKILSYILSKLLQLQFRIRLWIFGLKPGSSDITKTGKWSTINPFSGSPEKYYKCTYWYKRYYYGKYSHAMIINFETPKNNPCFWMIELGFGKVQEIDVFETMVVNNKYGIYFSLYSNEKSNLYNDPRTGERLYNRFQTRMRGLNMMAYLSCHKLDYCVKWAKNYVIWYIAGIPVAISFVYVPHQPLWFIISNYQRK